MGKTRCSLTLIGGMGMRNKAQVSQLLLAEIVDLVLRWKLLLNYVSPQNQMTLFNF